MTRARLAASASSVKSMVPWARERFVEVLHCECERGGDRPEGRLCIRIDLLVWQLTSGRQPCCQVRVGNHACRGGGNLLLCAVLGARIPAVGRTAGGACLWRSAMWRLPVPRRADRRARATVRRAPRRHVRRAPSMAERRAAPKVTLRLAVSAARRCRRPFPIDRVARAGSLAVAATGPIHWSRLLSASAMKALARPASLSSNATKSAMSSACGSSRAMRSSSRCAAS